MPKKATSPTPSPQEGILLLLRDARPIRQGESIAPAKAGVRLVGPAKYKDGTPVTLVWVQLAETGEWRGHGAGPFEISIDTFDEICRNFALRGLPVPFDYEHASELPASEGSIPVHGAPAVGWVHRLVNKGVDGLWGLVEWLDDAREQIRAGKYAFVSPAIRFASRDPKTGKDAGARLTSAALTNGPFLTGLPELIAASDKATTMDLGVADVHTPSTERTLATCMSAMRDAMGGHADAAGTGCTALHAACRDLVACYDDVGDDVAMKLTVAQGEASKATLLLRQANERITSLDAEVRELKAAKAQRDEAELQREVGEAFDTWKDKKQLKDGDRSLLLSWARADRDGFRKMYPPVPTDQRFLLRDLVPPEHRERPAPTQSDLNALTSTFMSQGMGYLQALSEATQAIRARSLPR